MQVPAANEVELSIFTHPFFGVVVQSRRPVLVNELASQQWHTSRVFQGGRTVGGDKLAAAAAQAGGSRRAA